MARVGIALGSNLGNRSQQLTLAISRLREIATPSEPFLTAPIYQTAPRFCPPDSPSFLNTVIEMDFMGSHTELLQLTQSFETELGRIPSATRNAPRAIDIDLLYFGDFCINEPSLVLPHPRLHERRFVLEPLAAIRPSLVLPHMTHSISELLETLITDEPPLERVGR